LNSGRKGQRRRSVPKIVEAEDRGQIRRFQDTNEILPTALNTSLWGGYAVSFHAQPRVTKDLDILIQPDAGNAKAVYAALAKFRRAPRIILFNPGRVLPI